MSGGADDRGQSEIVEGTITSVVYHNDENGYTVLHVEPPSNGFELARGREITIVGKAQAVWEGEDVRASGQWVTDKVHGRQFKADDITCVAPKSIVGIERYLASGLIKGVGSEMAGRIVEKFGADGKAFLDKLGIVRIPGNEVTLDPMLLGAKFRRRADMVILKKNGVSKPKNAAPDAE